MTKIIYLDAGHGGTDSGAVGNGLKEKNITLELVKLTMQYLNSNYDGHKVVLTRSTDVFVELAQRCKLANVGKADLFVSMHINAATSSSAKGMETYVYTKASATSKAYQKKMHASLLKNAPYFIDRGMKSANYQVLRSTTGPSMLTECGFISNVEDTNVLKTTQKLKDIALAHAIGIADCLGLPKKTTVNATSYTVKVGSYSDKEKADQIRTSIEKMGYKDVTVVKE